MAILQALIAFLGRSAGKILNAVFGWAVRALFGGTSGAESRLLTVVVALAALWPILLVGIAWPKVAVFALTFVPLPKWVSDETVRWVWMGLALATPLILGIALGSKQPNDPDAAESRFVRVLRGFPATVAIALGFWLALFTVPVMHLIAIARGWRDVHVPFITKEEFYWDAALEIERVLNARGFELLTQPPPFLVRTSMRVMRAIGGPSVQRYIPERLAYLVGPKIRLTLYPSSLLLRGTRGACTIAHGLAVEALARTDTYQSTDPAAQEVEREIRQIWRVYEENPRAHEGSRWLEGRLVDVSEKIARLETSYDDWQTVYRQALQLGRAVDGRRQLLEKAEGVTSEAEGRDMVAARRPRWPRERGTTDLLVEITAKSGELAKKEFELARSELKEDLKAELSAAKLAGVSLVAGLATMNLLLVAAVFGLASFMPPWVAALSLAGATLLATVVGALLAKGRHVEKPLEKTQKTLLDDVSWAKERVA